MSPDRVWRWAVRSTAVFMLGVGLSAAEPAPKVPVTPAPLILDGKVSIEDGKPALVATATAGDEPLAGVSVAFFFRRSFGAIRLGEDTTLEDGTAAVTLGSPLPPGPSGKWDVRLQVLAPPEFAGQEKLLALDPPELPTLRRQETQPRALWAPKAPLVLIFTLLLIVGAIWATYGLVVYNLFRLKKGESHA